MPPPVIVKTEWNPRWREAPWERSYIWGPKGPPNGFHDPAPIRFATHASAKAYWDKFVATRESDLSLAVPPFLHTYTDGSTREAW